MLEDRSLPVSHRKSLAARRKGSGIALGMQSIGIQVMAGCSELAIALRTHTRHLHTHLARLLRLGIKQVEISSRVIDQTLAVACQAARIEVMMCGMPLQILASRRARVDVTNTLMIRQEVDALTNPAGISEIAIEGEQAFES